MILEIVNAFESISMLWPQLKQFTGTSDWSLTFLITWLTWLIVGTIFYTYELKIGWSQGFYMAVNVGYSIGWGDIPEDDSSQLFSTFYVIVGASFVAAALGYFAQNIISDRDNWYVNELQRVAYEKTINQPDLGFAARCDVYINYHIEKFRGIFVWAIFIVTATGCAWGLNEDYNFINALYFAVSSLSTGGLHSLPADSPNWYYGLTGLYAAFGVPIMGVAMATLASFFIDVGNIKDTMDQIKTQVTEEELKMLVDFQIANGDNVIDKAEFIILSMVRIGAATPELITLIIEYFNYLDTDNSGELSLEEITQRITETRDGQIESTTRLIEAQSKEFVHDILGSETSVIRHIDEENPPVHRKVSCRRRESRGHHDTNTSDIEPTFPTTANSKGTISRPPTFVGTERLMDDSDSSHDSASPVRIRFPGNRSATPSDKRTGQLALSSFEKAWKVLNDTRYIKPDHVDELQIIMNDLGVYEPNDLADISEEVIAQTILPLLKMAPRNRIVRTLDISPSLLEKEEAYVSPIKANQHQITMISSSTPIMNVVESSNADHVNSRSAHVSVGSPSYATSSNVSQSSLFRGQLDNDDQQEHKSRSHKKIEEVMIPIRHSRKHK